MVERRKYPRFKISHMLKYSDAERDSSLRNEGVTRTVDVSRGGLRITRESTIPIGKILNLKIYTSPGAEPVEATGRVVWVRKVHDNSFLMGVSFTKIGWVETDKLFMPAILETDLAAMS